MDCPHLLYGEIPIREITSSLLREYVLWCSNEKDYNGGHPFKQEYGAGHKGLLALSVNVRIRILITFFNELYEENIIDHIQGYVLMKYVHLKSRKLTS